MALKRQRECCWEQDDTKMRNGSETKQKGLTRLQLSPTILNSIRLLLWAERNKMLISERENYKSFNQIMVNRRQIV